MNSSGRDSSTMLSKLDLKDYEEIALENLLSLGRTTAPNLAEAAGIPKARIYGVLDSLADKGYIKIIPGRPKKYQPKPPEEILERAVENQRQDYEQYKNEINGMKEEFLEKFGEIYETSTEDITPTEELFYVVDVGEPSETETRKIYDEAEKEVNILTKGFEYFDRIEPALSEAVDRGIEIKVLFLDPKHLSDDNLNKQTKIIEKLETDYSDVGMRYSAEKLPWRGTLADPSMEYETGRAILLVEEKDVPMSMRQAAVTENGSFVAGMKRYFDLIWRYDSKPVR